MSVKKARLNWRKEKKKNQSSAQLSARKVPCYVCICLSGKSESIREEERDREMMKKQNGRPEGEKKIYTASISGTGLSALTGKNRL